MLWIIHGLKLFWTYVVYPVDRIRAKAPCSEISLFFVKLEKEMEGFMLGDTGSSASPRENLDLSFLIVLLVADLIPPRVTSWTFWQHIVCFDRAKRWSMECQRTVLSFSPLSSLSLQMLAGVSSSCYSCQLQGHSSCSASHGAFPTLFPSWLIEFFVRTWNQPRAIRKAAFVWSFPVPREKLCLNKKKRDGDLWTFHNIAVLIELWQHSLKTIKFWDLQK